jgi:hypothetical protein
MSNYEAHYEQLFRDNLTRYASLRERIKQRTVFVKVCLIKRLSF